MVGDDVVGYTADVCTRVVDSIREKIGIPGLKTVRVPVSNFSGTLMLLTGSIDLDCSATTTNTSIRQQRVAFGFTTFVSGIKALVLADTGIDRIGDLADTCAHIVGRPGSRIMLDVNNRRTGLARFFLNHIEHVAGLLRNDARRAALQDAGLLGRDLGQGLAQILLMVDADRGDDGQCRLFHHIGGVQPPAKSYLQQRPVGLDP